MGRLTTWTVLALVLLAFAATVQDVRADVPSENECRPYIEKALHELKADAAEDGVEVVSAEDDTDDDDQSPEADTEAADSTPETSPEDDEGDDGGDDDGADDDGDDDKASAEDDDNASEAKSAADDEDGDGDEDDNDDDNKSGEDVTEEDAASREKRSAEDADDADDGDDDGDDADDSKTDDDAADDDDSAEASSTEAAKSAEEDTAEDDTAEDVKASAEDADSAEAKDGDSKEAAEEEGDSKEEEGDEKDDDKEDDSAEAKSEADDDEDDNKSAEADADDDADSKEEETEDEEATKSDETETADEKSAEDADDDDDDDNKSEGEAVISAEASVEKTEEEADDDTEEASREKRDISGEDKADGEEDDTDDDDEDKSEAKDSKQDETDDSAEDEKAADEDSEEEKSEVTKPVESFPEDDLLIEYIVPTNLRDHSHVTEILRLDEEFDEKEAAINKVADVVLKDLKKIYENAIKPLETLYKYRDLSNRHFGDPEIFSKPLVLFMGPWSGGKSTILNYLTENEHTDDSLRTGAEPSPAYFNILMHGDKPEVLDGTQLAADWTFSGLQKFGQGLEDRLRGQKLPHKLLEKVNIVEIPGILEVRKQVSRLFPFNDACQWFIDRADIIFLVYDPSKLDVGPETEAILDQLKGREYQTRILLNKADQVKPEELLRVQGALIWNISPLMSSAQPPVMYTTSLWSHPYEEGAPVRLLQAQERALLRDLRAAIDKRIDNKIASARRFAVRVRNHAKMVDCYLTTYYNHKTLFGNKNLIANNIIENPQNYHIYEGLSTLTNISRYDLPDPEVYRDFFRLNKLYDFQKLSETCTYFRGCPINKLDVAIAYDLPELVGKYKKAAEAALISIEKKADGGKS